MQQPLETHESVEVSFHGLHYTLTVQVSADDILTLDIEDAESLARWRGTFPAKYVEDITSKTGSFKKFGVFVRMLVTAARGQSDAVFMDLLTYQDLEALKSKKQQAAAAAAAAATGGPAAGSAAAAAAAAARPLPAAAAGKRYLILTYASEFDRVHYPLPLAQEDGPDAARLMAVISQLRSEVVQLKTGRQGGGGSSKRAAAGRGGGRRGGDLGEDDLAGDDRADADAARRGSGGQACSSCGGAGAAAVAQRLEAALQERDLLRARLEAAEADAEREAGLHRRELRRKAKEWQELHDELLQARDTIRELRASCKQLEAGLDPSARRRSAARASMPGAPAAAPLRAASTGRSGYGSSGGGRGPDAYNRWPSGGGGGSYAYQPGSSKYPSSGGGSRGATPPRASSGGGAQRGQSPGYARPWAIGTTSGPTTPRGAPIPAGRPASAPPRPRFDPTEYVRQKRDREAAAAAQRGAVFGGGAGGGSRGGTPARAGSRSSSAAASPYGSRPGSRGGSLHDGGGRGGYSPAAQPRGRERLGYGSSGGASIGSRHGSVSRERGGPAPRSLAASPAAHNHAAPPPPAAAASGAGGWRAASPDGHRSNVTSPGRALQSVQQKLSEFVSRQQQPQQQGGRSGGFGGSSGGGMHAGVGSGSSARGAGGVGHVAATPTPAAAAVGGDESAAAASASGTMTLPAVAAGGVFEDASCEIADIDKRLASLQNFLRTAKAGQAAAVGS